MINWGRIEVISNRSQYSFTDFLTSESKAYNLLNDNDNPFWIDTQCADGDSDWMTWGYAVSMNSGINFDGLYTSYNGDVRVSYGIRAIVSLKSNVKLVEGTDGWTLQQ